jgi:outer membrane receptor for ferrienterochelin and colicin
MYLKRTAIYMAVIVSTSLNSRSVVADETTIEAEVEILTIEQRRTNLMGTAISASQGEVNATEIAIRPMLRTGEILEWVPGMVVTQHSGTGKANQYFLRGFNLDHGTDFATFMDGMPVNMRTHGHGQGYTDLNFIIPETIERIAYNKGAYYIENGDFSGAGGANLISQNQMQQGLAELTIGQDSYQRLVAVDSLQAGSGNVLWGAELNRYDGPWSDINEDLRKLNLLLKYSGKLAGGKFSLSGMAYDNSWNSADQIPQRAVEAGLIDELGSLDTTVGGKSSRYSLHAQWQDEHVNLAFYTIRYDLNLWSNFTYFLDDETQGDQFEQVDERLIYGGEGSYQFSHQLGGHSIQHKVGLQWRMDDIAEVGLYRTRQQIRLGAIRSDAVDEQSIGLFWQSQIQLSNRIRTELGVRYDTFNFAVDSLIDRSYYAIDVSKNRGKQDDDTTSLKASLIYTLNNEWESYVSLGQGFHSNDARGTINQVDPIDGSPIEPVDPLVSSLGYEVGIRGQVNEQLNTSLALWVLKLDSELLFVGDAGNTEASRGSKRQGLELTAYYRINEQLTADLEYAYTDAEFTEDAIEGRFIPGAINNVLQAGLSAQFENGLFGSLRWRYFGERPLIEDASVKSEPTSVANLRIGYNFASFSLKFDILNLFDSNDHDIDYYYSSRLGSEPSGLAVDDIHYHVLEPRTVRASVTWQL